MPKELLSGVNFRPTKESRGVLDDAKDVGLELTEFMNGLVEKYGKDYVVEAAQQKIRKLQQVLATR